MLKTRVLTAALALPVAVAVILSGSEKLLMTVFALFVAFCTYEMAMMVVPRLEAIFNGGGLDSGRSTQYPRWLVAVAVLFSCLIFLGSALDSEAAGRGMIVFGVLGSIFIGSFFSNDTSVAVARIASLLLAISYGAFPWLATWELFLLNSDGRYIIFLIAIVWSGDTGAYFGGKFYGKRKLAAKISPNKTIEGAVAGVAASLVAGLLIYWVYEFSLGSIAAVVVAAFLGAVFGQMGDLVESTFKRFALVKDSGSIFPGHGGFLDRVDGILFAAPVVWLAFYLLG